MVLYNYSMNIFYKSLFLTTFSFFSLALGVSAQEVDTQLTNDDQAEVLRVSTIVREPFVIQDGPELTGFSIDLWNLISGRNDWVSEYVVTDRFVQLLNSVKKPADSDVAISNISITSDREQVMDFSSSIYDGGLQIMIPNTESNSGFVAAIATKNVAQLVLYTLFAFLLLGYGMNKLARAESWQGSLRGSYWNLITLGQYGDALPYKNNARAVFVLWIIIATSFVVLATAEITSTMITNKMGGTVNSYLDLQNKKVGVSAGSTSENFMRTNKITSISFDSIDEMFEQVASGQLDAVVHDSPVIRHYVTYSGRGRVIAVGEIFNKEQYGIALPENSPLREQINTTLLQLREEGVYEDLYNKWFNK